MKKYLLSFVLFISAFSQGDVSFNAQLKKLPLDTSSFKIFIEDNYLYVDKTKKIHSLIQSGRHYFLVRPRRFGRTLFLSTLKEIFLGHKELFKDCWIGKEDRYDWPAFKVINFNFITIDYRSPDAIEKSLLHEINYLAKEHYVQLANNLSLEQALTEFVNKLSGHGKIVLLIDEYDKPFREHQFNKETAIKVEQVLKRFYTTIGKMDDYFRAIIVTGVVPYGASMLFSAIPTLKNISFSDEASDLCGFTEQEMNAALLPHIEKCAKNMKKSNIEVIQEMQKLYGGYRFTVDGPDLCSPIPTLYHLYRMDKNQRVWTETSTSYFIAQWIEKFPSLFHKQELWNIPKMYGDDCGVGDLTQTAAFWYSGFLTLAKEQRDDGSYDLISPNQSTTWGLNALIPKR